MQYIVCKVTPPASENRRGEFSIASPKDYIKKYYVREVDAIEAAKAMAEADPGTQYFWFKIGGIFEALKPAKPKLVEKKINDAGEIVVI